VLKTPKGRAHLDKRGIDDFTQRFRVLDAHPRGAGSRRHALGSSNSMKFA
jgi:hypothetical protein